MDKYFFITEAFGYNIKNNIIDVVFPKLNIEHKKLLLLYLLDIIDVIAIKFNFNLGKRIMYERQFTQNNYRDIKGLLYMLLPYIDDPNEIKTKNIKSLNDMYIAKKKDSILDINLGEPEYEYSNIQYGRCDRFNKSNNKEISFNKEHLNHNYILLKETIQICANKLYVNWLDVTPIPLNKFTYTSIYKNTINAVKKFKLVNWDVVIDNKDGREYKGLYVGDIYNVISNNLFYAIKNIKWVLYDTVIKNHEQQYPYLIILNNILPIQSCADGIEWRQLEDSQKDNFIKAWKNFINNRDIYVKNIEAVDINRLLESLIIFFNKYYRNKNEAIDKDKYIPLPFKLHGDDDDEISEKLDIEMGALYTSMNSLPAKHIYTYIKDCIDQLKLTWYRLYLLDKDTGKVSSIEKYTVKTGVFVLTLTMKNIYNISKSLTHFTPDKKQSRDNKQSYVQYPRYWRSLSSKDKDVILKLLNWDTSKHTADELMNWFNISSYFRRINIVNKKEIQKRHVSYFTQFRYMITEIVFKCLTINGILSTFEPEPRLTDNTRLPKQYNKRKKVIMDRLSNIILKKDGKIKDNWKDSHYFLTSNNYGSMEIIYEDKKTGKQEKKSYLDYIADEDTGFWFTTYAMAWISQLSFFHKYLNNRIIYVTGATGVGKSTQIPKLLLYALKMIDYKYDGQIAVTQPRIPPTVNITKTISSQMGVPIEEYNDTYKKNIKTSNYYIQYKYKQNSHKKYSNNLMLRLMTDGTLYEELKNNPILKKKKKEKYTDKNIYDIVVVDEAHEHNKNMDFILSFMKYALYYNNSIKLVIISATMDADEPNYRRYYRDINDNKMYPINHLIIDNKLDRINVDRRLHISPPGEGTRHAIHDKYVPNEDPIDIIVKIINTTSSGDILFFQPGRREINDSVDKLNSKIPANVIALPYHGQMSQDKKTFIEELNDDTKKKFNIPKNVQYDTNYDESLIKAVPYGTYNRFIIVATNLAEASITISSLKYVVDTGISKVNEYDYRTRSSNLLTKSISESSRIQRRGRVGRVSEGWVYYTYEKDKMLKNKIQFNISISDINENLYDIMYANNNESLLFGIDPNDLKNTDLSKLEEYYPNNLHKIIKEQYYYKDVIIDYHGKDDHYDYQHNKKPHDYHETGYSINALNDHMGDFYIIHPDELDIKRNITGEIIAIIDRNNVQLDNKILISYKLNSFWKILSERNFIINISNSNDYVKTEYGVNINKLKRVIDVDIGYIISYVYSRKYGCAKELLQLIPLYTQINKIIDIFQGTFQDGKYTIPINHMKALYGNPISDSKGILDIVNKIIDYVHNNIIKLDIYDKDIIPRECSTSHGNKVTGFASESREIIKIIEIEKQLYIKNKTTKDFKGIDYKRINKFIELDANNKLDNNLKMNCDEIKEFIKNDTIANLYELSEKHIDILKKWCHKNHFNYITVTTYINEYMKLKNSIYKIDKKIKDINYDDVKEDKTFKWFDENLNINKITSDKNQNVILSLLHGFGTNIVRKIDGSNVYISVRNPHPSNVYQIQKMFRFSKELDTLINKVYMSEYLLYIKKKNDEIFLLHGVTPKMIQSVASNIYNPEAYLPNNYNIDEYREAMVLLLSQVDKTKKSVLKSNMVGNYINTIKQIKRDMLDNYNINLSNNVKYNDKTIVDIFQRNRRKQSGIIRNIIGQTGGNKNIHINFINSPYIRYIVDNIVQNYTKLNKN